MSSILDQVGSALSKNAPVLTTTLTIASAGAAVVLASRAGYKSQQILRREEIKIQALKEEPLNRKEKITLTWKFYIPAAVALGICVASVIALNRVGERRLASFAAVAAVADRTFTEFRDKVEDRLEDDVVEEIKDSITQDRVNANPPSERIVIEEGEQLCLDGYTGRYFSGSVHAVQYAANVINMDILNNGFASLTDYYDLIGLDATTISDDVGWSNVAMLEPEFGSAIAPGDRPCLEVLFRNQPVSGFDRVMV